MQKAFRVRFVSEATTNQTERVNESMWPQRLIECFESNNMRVRSSIASLGEGSASAVKKKRLKMLK